MKSIYNIYEGILDDNWVDTVETSSIEDQCLSMMDELSGCETWRRWKVVGGSFKLKMEKDTLVISSPKNIVIDRASRPIFEKYSSILKYKHIKTNALLVISGESISDFVNSVTCPSIRFSAVPEVKDFMIFIDGISNHEAIMCEYSDVNFKNVKIKVLRGYSSYNKMYSHGLPSFENCTVEGIGSLQIYGPSIFSLNRTLAWINQIFDTKHKMEIESLGSTPVNKLCQMRNIRAVAMGMKTGKYNSNPNIYSYLKIKDSFKLDNLIEVSGFDQLTEIDIRDNDVVLKLSNFDFRTDREDYIKNGSPFVCTPLRAVLPNDNWGLWVVTR